MTELSVATAYDFERAAPECVQSASVAAGVVFSLEENLQALERDWRDFQRQADGTVFQTFEWLSTWQRHIGERHDVRPAILIGRDAQKRILFLLPLATQPTAFGRELVWLGMELCDYTGPLLARDFSQRVDHEAFAQIWRESLRMLAGHPHLAFDLIRLEKMPALIGEQPNPLLGLAVRRHPSGAYWTPLAPSWDEFYAAKRSASTRRRDRTKRKALEARGAVRFVEPETDAERLQSLETLMRQKAHSFARMGVFNLFEHSGYAEFYRAIVSEPIAHLSRLDIGERVGAINLGLMDRGRYYHLLASYSEDPEIARLGPGAAHLMEMMANAIRRGCAVFDFTIGDEPYKRDWCDTRQILHDHLAARTPAGAVMLACRTAKLHLKRTIKENPTLWAAFQRWRAAAARALRTVRGLNARP